MIVILITHVIGAGIIIGGNILAIVLLSAKKVTKATLEVIESFGNIIKYAAISQLVTGGMLYMAEPQKFRGNKFLWVKLILYVISGFMGGAVIQKRVKKLQSENEAKTTSLNMIFILHLVIIIFIVAIGVFLAESD